MLYLNRGLLEKKEGKLKKILTMGGCCDIMFIYKNGNVSTFIEVNNKV